MANTKNIQNKAERKAAKRAQRTDLKAAFQGLTPDQKRRYRNGETSGVRKFIAELKD